MVVKIINLRPWPLLQSKKFKVTIVICRLQGLLENSREFSKLGVEVNWKGSGKTNNRLNFKRSCVKRSFTKEKSLNDDGVFEWNEEFATVCDLVWSRDGCFHKWEIALQVFDALNQGQKRWNDVVATGSLNLTEFASFEQEKTPINVHLSMPCSVECSPILSVLISLNELRSINGDEPGVLKSGLKKVKFFKTIMPKNRSKKACREEDDSVGKSSVTTNGSDYPFDTDSYDGSDGIDSEEIDSDSDIKISYFKLNGSEGEDVTCLQSCIETRGSDKLGEVTIVDQAESQTVKRGLFPWRKRKLTFRSPKVKGEPLLKRGGGGEGGDDIDFDRRMLTSSDESSHGWHDEGSTTSRSSTSEFGDDNFVIGKWENTEITNRDGNTKLTTQVFFASIDQRSEKACGESACTSLVATIANWLHNNHHQQLPIKSELDSLIMQGSLEWRHLCENKAYKTRFPDKHFDLETILESNTCNLEVVPEKSFIGFFHPEGGDLDFLHGAMSFDDIWDEISQIQSQSQSGSTQIYIVSWNDHFFILKVEKDAYYIIDTLGERLYEGCNQAYVLKFDQDTRIEQKSTEKNLIVSKGKESCRAYITRFLAAIPVRELHADVKKGVMPASSAIVHHRLQIEFHYTTLTK